jgi:hypothetical protein
MDKVQRIDLRKTAPSSKTFRDELQWHVLHMRFHEYYWYTKICGTHKMDYMEYELGLKVIRKSVSHSFLCI